MKKHSTIRISGLVQGVYFRGSTKEQADAMGITGFVRNEPDGSVYIEAEGEEKTLHDFVQWCQHGPSHARVEKCEVSEDVLKDFSRFIIAR
jgi:acylphosphatase